jgi:DNA-binding Xre family transcriptional regulator
VRWNLRLAAAKRGIWDAAHLQRLLAEHGLVLHPDEMARLWSGRPGSVNLEELDLICSILTCPVGELLEAEPRASLWPGPAEWQRAWLSQYP